MKTGQKVESPNGERGEVLRFNGWDWQATILTTGGKRVPCHPTRLRPIGSERAGNPARRAPTGGGDRKE